MNIDALKRTNAGLQKTIEALRAKNRKLNQELESWKMLALYNNQLEPQVNKDIIVLIGQYSGGHYDSLSLPGKLFTAIAWDNFPDASFDNLVESLKEISPMLSEMISEHSITFHVLAKRDFFKDSLFCNEEEITCDTEGWYEEIPGYREFAINASEDLISEVEDAIADFAVDVCNEVKENLEKQWNLTPSQILEIFRSIDESL